LVSSFVVQKKMQMHAIEREKQLCIYIKISKIATATVAFFAVEVIAGGILRRRHVVRRFQHGRS
jgi:hypothetical protein